MQPARSAYLLKQSKALWNSYSARWYSSAKISHCSNVIAILVLSLALLQLVKRIPKTHEGVIIVHYSLVHVPFICLQICEDICKTSTFFCLPL